MSALDELRRHPWNRDFAWVPSEPPFSVLSPEQAASFDRDGFVVVPDVFDAATLAEVTAEIDGFEAEVEAGLRRRDGERFAIAEAGAITFATHLVARSERLRAFSTHPFFVGVCADLIGPDVNLYWDQGVYKKPEKPRRFPWHQDNGYAFVEPQQYLTCWVALTDATVDNGCPQVARGLHRPARSRTPTSTRSASSACTTPTTWPSPRWVRAAWWCSRASPRTSPARTPRAATRKAYILQHAPRGRRAPRRPGTTARRAGAGRRPPVAVPGGQGRPAPWPASSRSRDPQTLAREVADRRNAASVTSSAGKNSSTASSSSVTSRGVPNMVRVVNSDSSSPPARSRSGTSSGGSSHPLTRREPGTAATFS